MIYFTDHDIDRLIEDDVPMGDMTSLLLQLNSSDGSISIAARHPMVVCCTEEAKRIYEKAGLTVTQMLPSGTYLQPGEVFITAQGKADAIHLIWRTGGTLMEYASGVATRTRLLIEKAKPFNEKISVAGTRKHPPFLKKVALKGLLAGGGVPHRTGLSDTILIFREHLCFVGGYDNLPAVISQVRNQQKERKIVVEAHNEDDALKAAHAGADALQLDKLSPETLTSIALKSRAINPHICILAAGGVNAENAAAYAKAGADALVSSWMYFGPPADIQVKIDVTEK
jgi:molybdenum transport protein